jgi:pimeloyl-ACP methyl ester carboxylesterase
MPSKGQPIVTDPDFYLLEQTLEPEGRELLHKVREFMEKSVQPVINHYWTREEFPFDLLPDLKQLGIAGLAYDGYDCPGGGNLLDGMVAMELARVDPSIGTFFGVHSGLAMGSIYLCGSEEQKQRWLRTPTLIMAGDDDPIIPLVNARLMNTLIPDSRLHVYHGGHLGLITEAAELAPVVDTFLAAPDCAD